jgi:hypothetical protein
VEPLPLHLILLDMSKCGAPQPRSSQSPLCDCFPTLFTCFAAPTMLNRFAVTCCRCARAAQVSRLATPSAASGGAVAIGRLQRPESGPSRRVHSGTVRFISDARTSSASNDSPSGEPADLASAASSGLSDASEDLEFMDDASTDTHHDPDPVQVGQAVVDETEPEASSTVHTVSHSCFGP